MCSPVLYNEREVQEHSTDNIIAGILCMGRAGIYLAADACDLYELSFRQNDIL